MEGDDSSTCPCPIFGREVINTEDASTLGSFGAFGLFGLGVMLRSCVNAVWESKNYFNHVEISI